MSNSSITEETFFSAALHGLILILLISGLEGGILPAWIYWYLGIGALSTSLIVDTLMPRLNISLYSTSGSGDYSVIMAALLHACILMFTLYIVSPDGMSALSIWLIGFAMGVTSFVVDTCLYPRSQISQQ